eukprot:1181369-Prorocentrum_minimum.AAC.5
MEYTRVKDAGRTWRTLSSRRKEFFPNWGYAPFNMFLVCASILDTGVTVLLMHTCSRSSPLSRNCRSVPQVRTGIFCLFDGHGGDFVGTTTARMFSAGIDKICPRRLLDTPQELLTEVILSSASTHCSFAYPPPPAPDEVS